MPLKLETMSGPAIRHALPELSRLRMTVFRAWPYLYDGTADYEESYIGKFSRADGAAIIAARDGAEIVGMATASPLLGHDDAFVQALAARGFDTSSVFYFGESVLLPPYRNQGVGHAFFDQREAHARRFGPFTHAAFCAVVRPEDHPLKPTDARSLDAFWKKRGYAPIPGLVASFGWKDIDQPHETQKPMQFWMREL